MRTISIIKFLNEKQDRVKLIQTLVTYNSTIGIKKAKDYIDLMINDKIPFDFLVDDTKLDELTKELEKLKLKYEVKQNVT
jgi:hypothetical protein